MSVSTGYDQVVAEHTEAIPLPWSCPLKIAGTTASLVVRPLWVQECAYSFQPHGTRYSFPRLTSWQFDAKSRFVYARLIEAKGMCIPGSN